MHSGPAKARKMAGNGQAVFGRRYQEADVRGKSLLGQEYAVATIALRFVKRAISAFDKSWEVFIFPRNRDTEAHRRAHRARHDIRCNLLECRSDLFGQLPS